MPEPVFKKKEIDGGPGSIPEFLKKKPEKEERKKEEQIRGGPDSLPDFLKKKPMEEKKKVEEPEISKRFGPEFEKKKEEEPKEKLPLESMLKKANDARAASDAAEKEMIKGEKQLREIEMQVARQEKQVDELRSKAR